MIGEVKPPGAGVVDVTTEVSVVGKFPGKEVPFAFTPGRVDGGGAFVDPTTDVSSVGKRGGAAAAGVGEMLAAASCGGACSPARFAFSSAVC